MDGVDPETVEIQLYAEPEDGDAPKTHVMNRGERIAGPALGYQYEIQIETDRPLSHFTPRAVANLCGLSVPIEANMILWSG
jgi:starch phosphorylase